MGGHVVLRLEQGGDLALEGVEGRRGRRGRARAGATAATRRGAAGAEEGLAGGGDLALDVLEGIAAVGVKIRVAEGPALEGARGRSRAR